MLILKNKKGFTLIEVLCSIAVFSTLFMAAFSIEVNVIKVKKLNNQIYNYASFMEELKNVMICNSSYDEIQKLKLENKCYICKENIQIGQIKYKGVNGIFQKEPVSEEPYLVMDIEGDKVLKIKLELHAKYLDNKKILECELYKGKYKR